MEDEDEPLMKVPHGYAFNDDPYENRNNIEIPAMDLLFLTMGFVVKD